MILRHTFSPPNNTRLDHLTERVDHLTVEVAELKVDMRQVKTDIGAINRRLGATFDQTGRLTEGADAAGIRLSHVEESLQPTNQELDQRLRIFESSLASDLAAVQARWAQVSDRASAARATWYAQHPHLEPVSTG